MQSIFTELNNQIKNNPDRLLYSFLDIKGAITEEYTYSEFDVRTKTIASYLYTEHDFKVGDRILLAYPPGLEMICAFFACARLGLVPVPVYPPSANGFESSLRKMHFIATDCDATAILTTKAYQLSFQINLARLQGNSSSKKLENLSWIATNDIGSFSEVTYKEGHSEILFLQYTSGSTNAPKGVIITHKNLLDNCENVVDHTPIGVSWLPQYHDMGLIGYYLFFALKGGTTYGFSPTNFIMNPSLWLETISKYKATATSAPNFAFDYCIQAGKISKDVLAELDLSTLKFVMNAAEPVKGTTYQKFIEKFHPHGLNPAFSFAAYGLAENTLAVTNYGKTTKYFNSELLKEGRVHEIITETDNNEKVVQLMSCGYPLGDTKVKIVSIDAPHKALQNDSIGEIWVSGSSKGKGYWNRAKLSDETFNARLEHNEDSWLRTGDLGFIQKEELYVCGRLKDMIIIRGLNYYPHDIESIIEEENAVRVGCVAAFSVETELDAELVVVIGIKNKRNIPDMKGLNSKVLNYLGINIDQAIFVLARDVAKTSSGKIRRSENKRLYEQQLFDVVDTYKSFEDSISKESNSSEKGTAPNTPLDKLFASYNLTTKDTTSLGDAGLDSLKLAEFAHDLKQIIIQLKFDDLAEEIDLRIIQKIAVSELYEIVSNLSSSSSLARFRFKQSITKIQNEYIEIENKLMHRDTISILDSPEALDQLNPFSTNGKVLVTGGTGFFGPFIIKSLLEQQEDDIYVLVRAKDKTEGFKRLKEAFLVINCEETLQNIFDKRVKAIPGDLNKFKLGLNSENWNDLTQNIHTIYHNGALVNYLLDYESMRSANVDGTNEIIRLASTTRVKTLNYISTTFIFGWSTKDILFESDSNSEMELLDFGYSQSKWVSEKVVAHAMKNGLPVRIFRPALISPSIDGFGYNFDISIRLLAFMVKYGIGTTAKNQISFTPADTGANNIVAIANIPESINKTFNVTRDEFSSMEEVTQILSRLSGKDFKHYSLKDFVPEVIDKCQKEDLLFPLLNFLVRSIDNISSMEFKRYDNENYVKYRKLSAYGIEDSSLTEVVTGIFKFMVNNDIITKNILAYGEH